MNNYFQFQKSTKITLCDCIVDRLTEDFDGVVFHFPCGVVSCGTDDALVCTSAFNVRFVGCTLDSVLCFMVKQWSFFGRRLKVSSVMDVSQITKLLNSGFRIRLSEEYFAYKKMYLKASLIDRTNGPISKEIVFKLDDIEKVEFIKE